MSDVILCEHVRVIQRSHKLSSQTIYDWRHYLAVVQRKSGALRNGAPFPELPPAFRQLQDHILRRPGGDREPNGDAGIPAKGAFAFQIFAGLAA